MFKIFISIKIFFSSAFPVEFKRIIGIKLVLNVIELLLVDKVSLSYILITKGFLIVPSFIIV